MKDYKTMLLFFTKLMTNRTDEIRAHILNLYLIIVRFSSVPKQWLHFKCLYHQSLFGSKAASLFCIPYQRHNIEGTTITC